MSCTPAGLERLRRLSDQVDGIKNIPWQTLFPLYRNAKRNFSQINSEDLLR
jgi:hypothetical protein